MQVQASKSFLVDLIMRQAYLHPKAAEFVFNSQVVTTVCPSCNCEFSVTLRMEQNRRVLWCQHCYATYREREVNAA